MPRRALIRTAVATAAVCATGLAPLAAGGAAYADGAGSTPRDTVIPAGSRWMPHSLPLLTAGADGYLLDVGNGAQWVTAADGAKGPVLATPAETNNGLSAQVLRTDPQTVVTITDYDSGAYRTVTAPAGQQMVAGAYGAGSILTGETAPDGTLAALHVIGTGSPRPADLTVTGLPEGAAVPGPSELLAQNRDFAVLRLTGGAAPGAAHTYLLDYRDATLREIFADVPAAEQTSVVLGADRVLAYTRGGGTAFTVRLADPTTAAERTRLPVVPGDAGSLLAVTGDQVLVFRTGKVPAVAGLPLLSVPVGGGDATTLLNRTDGHFAVASDGTVLVEGGAGPDDWAVRRIAAAPGADATVSGLQALPPSPAHVYGLSYSAGRLVYSSDTYVSDPLTRRDVTLGGQGQPPVIGDPRTLVSVGPTPVSCASGPACVHLQGLGAGSVAYVQDATTLRSPDPASTSGSRSVPLPAPGTVADGSGRYVLVNDTAAGGRQRVLDVLGSDTGVSRPVGAAALWGATLWTPDTAAGSVRPYDLNTRTYGATVKTGAGCVPKELQADGRWLYWSCGASAGVYDRTTGRDVRVPVGDAQLGDGFVVRHDDTAGTLVLTDVHSGAAVSSRIADLAASGYDDRGITWSVDKYSGGVAYVDAGQQVHILPLVDLTRSPLTVLVGGAGTSGAAPKPGTVPGGQTWKGDWTLSRPAASWTVAFTDAAGHVVATRGGVGPDPAVVSATWDTKDASGRYVADGRYTWTLTAQPTGGGAPMTVSGSLTVHQPPAEHDFTADGTGDLFGLTSSGHLDLRPGTGSGNVESALSSTGWPTSATYVPFGDLDRDRLNDLLVRDSAGKLWRYAGTADGSYAPSGPKTLIGPGWNAYDALASVGDLDRDGHPDLVARTPAGSLYLYAGDNAGGFAARTLIGGGWDTYNMLIGSQNPGADGGGARQLLARDAAGVLWAYDGDGKGHFTPRAKIGGGWNVFNSIVGVGHLAPGAGTDLVARDAAGMLWRYEGRSPSGFATRVRLGAGWQMYKSLF